MFSKRNKNTLRSDPKLSWRGHPRRRKKSLLARGQRDQSESFMGNAVERDQFSSRLTWALIFLSSLIVLGTLLYAVFFSGYFTVRNIIVINSSATPTLQADEIKRNLIDVQNKNLFLVDTQDIIVNVLRRNLRIRYIEAERILPDTIRVTIEEYPIVAHIWQGETNTNALVNDAGFIVSLIDNPQDFGTYVTIKTYDTRIWKTDMRVLPRKDLQYVLEAVKSFENQFGIKIERAEYFEPNREVHLVTSKGWVAWFSLDRAVPESIADLILAFDEAKISKEPFSSVDLRVPGKIFVCRRSGSCVAKPPVVQSPLPTGN